MNNESAAKAALTKTELARTLGVSIGTVGRWTRGGCPCFHIGITAGPGSRPRYELDKVRAWLEQRTPSPDEMRKLNAWHQAQGSKAAARLAARKDANGRGMKS